MSGLPMLTELHIQPYRLEGPTAAYPMSSPPPADAWTAVTASTNLCSLRVTVMPCDVPEGCVLFKPGAMYPHLRLIHLQYVEYLDFGSVTYPMPVSGQQLQLLCNSCPTLHSLEAALEAHSPPGTADLPLLQLPGLTHLKTRGLGAAALAVVDVVTQLSGLKELAVSHLEPHQFTNPALLQLTSLTALEKLELQVLPDLRDTNSPLKLRSTVSPGWAQALPLEQPYCCLTAITLACI